MLFERLPKEQHEFFDDLMLTLLNRHVKKPAQVRVKIIGYGDLHLGSDQIKVSPFFVLPNENEKFACFLDDLEAQTSKSDFSNGLEALALAMKSSWVENDEYTTIRQAIVLITAKPAYPLEKGQEKEYSNYPENMFSSLEDLKMAWEGLYRLDGTGTIMNPRAKRLIIYSPLDSYPWNEFLLFTNVMTKLIEPAKGGQELDRKVLLDDIVRSLR